MRPQTLALLQQMLDRAREGFHVVYGVRTKRRAETFFKRGTAALFYRFIRAMTQVDQVTQQAASAAEELSATAEELSAQAESLQQLIGYFRMTATTATAAVAAPRRTPAPAKRVPGAVVARAGAGNGSAHAKDADFTRF